jgi:3-hydroxyisobutyrate dehydrogenase
MMDAAYPIGFIGLGTMGQAMALALVKAGTRLLVWKCSYQGTFISPHRI